ncbi:hypothetical protein GN958_ATG06244 [Phytophthora infestans]|uniref:RxLR effector PexRD54 WY domain-containing protein n=1 Tax=Phytophthora infestans TaxID=4787 RepID=A0A8S9UZF9_PHYIN|nr:hypothetical protein GN958_ATG06244 [Phytophthora infestans]
MQPTHSDPTNPNRAASRFLLRKNNGLSDFNEERAGTGASISVVDKLKAAFSSSAVTPQQLQSWLNKEKSAAAVFTRMHLTKAGNKVLFHPQISAWIQYVDDLNAKMSTKGASAVSVLTTQYGDDVLYKMIQDAKRVPSMEGLASRLQREQLQFWITTRKDPTEVFRIFKLHTKGESMLSDSKFNAWVKYVDTLNVNNPEEPKLLISTLSKYIFEGDLLTMAKSTEGANSIATKLETEISQFWLNSHKTPAHAFTTDLRLGKTTHHLLENPLFSSWVKYVDAYIARYPDKKMTVIATLTRAFDDRDVAAILAAGRARTPTKQVAARLQSAQVEMWLSSGKSVDDVYRLLRMSAIFTTIETSFNDRPLLQILEEATKFPNLKNAAANMQATKINSIFKREEPPKEAFTLMGLDTVGDTLLSYLQFRKWMRYVGDFYQKHPTNQESWLEPLKGYYGWSGVEHMIDNAMENPNAQKIAERVEKAWHAAKKDSATKKLASKLEDALLDKWVAAREKPADLRRIFGDGQPYDKLLERYSKKLKA